MKVSDYIVEYLINRGISDIFGYPGGMVTHLMDSLSRRKADIKTHLACHEQGAAFAACGYAQAGTRTGAVFATSGPGATNLITGICNAYFDSVPVLFITGQVNTFESRGSLGIRQRGFQETDIVSMVHGVTKYADYVSCAENIRRHLDRAFSEMLNGRKGPALLDIPMDILRAEILPDVLETYTENDICNTAEQLETYADRIFAELEKAEKPCVLVGQGVRSADMVSQMRLFADRSRIPVISSMPAVDIINDEKLYYGFIGAYGHRAANFIAAKCDLLLAFGSRFDIRQTGKDRERFAPDARILRVDTDENELNYKVHSGEISILADLKDLLPLLNERYIEKKWHLWNQICRFIKDTTQETDQGEPNRCMEELSRFIPDDAMITGDVGQNQVWMAQSFCIKPEQRLLFSAGHGAMGYSLPAAAGAAVATGKPVYSFNGDGGFQMNLQELEMIVREQLPVKIVIFNNHALGMIRHFQEMYFDRNYFLTVEGHGYSDPDFKKIAEAYGLPYTRLDSPWNIPGNWKEGTRRHGPEIMEVSFSMDTYVFPKLEYGKPNQDQEPLLDRELYDLLMDDDKIKIILEKNKDEKNYC